MKKAKLLIQELAQLAGTELEFQENAICELAVNGRLLLLRYRPEDDDWLYFGFVTEGEEELTTEQLKKALCLNLFGAETYGLHLGLFDGSLVLSGTVAMDGLNADDFADKLLFLSKRIEALAEKIQNDACESAQEEMAQTPFSSNFISV